MVQYSYCLEYTILVWCINLWLSYAHFIVYHHSNLYDHAQSIYYIYPLCLK